MHGRIKVKTTAEQEEEKRRNQERKLKVFRKASALAFQKIIAKEYDETGLEVTGEILSRNSDLSSLWNYRKRAIIAKKDDSEEDRQNLCQKELELLSSCLRNNPKSYGCWHHRCFTMLNIPTPDWKNELKLCNQFLQLDDRNFHCWDYRRFIVKNSFPEVAIEDEIKVTEHLIENNFSNYSSWHYRSKLLPKKFPSVKSCEQIEERKLLDELEYVQNAFFTDPNDQSAWFYHQWLIGRGEQQQRLLMAHFDQHSARLTCIFKKPESLISIESCCAINARNCALNGKWIPIVSNFVKYCHGWIFEFDAEALTGNLCLNLNCFGENLEFDISNEAVETSKSFFKEDEFRQVLGETKLFLLKSELGSCIELNDLEPGNKWVILTLVQLMNVIDPDKYKEDINKYVSELQDIDPSRKCYYADLRSKIFMEQSISSGSFRQHTFDLSDMGISKLYHTQYFSCIKVLDVTKNKLVSLSGQLYLLCSCEQLLADDNEITDVCGVVNMPKLIVLSLKSNRLTSVDQLRSLSSCPCLKTVDVRQNVFTSTADLQAFLPEVEVTI